MASQKQNRRRKYQILERSLSSKPPNFRPQIPKEVSFNECLFKLTKNSWSCITHGSTGDFKNKKILSHLTNLTRRPILSA